MGVGDADERLSAPVSPMLARLSRTLPREGHVYEPKWDGFRCLAVREDGRLELWSRHGRPFARYFPELVAALAELAARLHPAASRVTQLAAATPASFFAFDVLQIGARDLRDEPFHERRRVLGELLAGAGPLRPGRRGSTSRSGGCRAGVVAASTA